MKPFTTEDATRFHGRTNEVSELLGRLRDGQRELYVIGPSGSGKSSLVAAGLVPSVRRWPERAGGSFLVRQLRPGTDPTAALGVYFEPVLVERLLHEVAGEPGALPLLQDTLLDLWPRRTRSLLRLVEYDAMSDGAQTDLAVTVARRANGALHDLSPGRQEIARRVMLRLVQFGDGAATTRRQQTRAALATVGDAPQDIDAVVRHLADRRLITTSGGNDADPAACIDLAHEVLLSAWPTLGEWIRTRRDDEQRRRVLEAKAAEWGKHGRGLSRLLDADELRELRGWLTEDAARNLGVSEEIQSFIARSEAVLAAQVAEAEDRRRRWRRW